MEELLRKIGSWLFLLGILIAVIVGIILGANQAWLSDYTTTISIVLAVLGFIVGVLSFFAVGSIAKDRVPTFLIGALLLVGIGATASGSFINNINVIGTYFQYIVGMIAMFVAPAAGLLAIRAIWDAGKSEDIEKVLPKMPK
jgi:hypothetical protein